MDIFLLIYLVIGTICIGFVAFVLSYIAYEYITEQIRIHRDKHKYVLRVLDKAYDKIHKKTGYKIVELYTKNGHGILVYYKEGKQYASIGTTVIFIKNEYLHMLYEGYPVEVYVNGEDIMRVKKYEDGT